MPLLAFFEQEKPEIVIDSAAKVGAIWANQEYPYTLLMENLQIQNNLIEASHHFGCENLYF
ncbi:NAD-dependent epimerase/dehydratase family protein [Algoriphagus boritolerans]|uniref:NAD-dependent epimerase/dehydratase family protein n=1 Tax=Algoriphagus boritolerans TaxID=308111 RepID=UPI000AA6022D